MTIDRIVIFPQTTKPDEASRQQELAATGSAAIDDPTPTTDESDNDFGPHLKNAEIIRLLQEILDLQRALNIAVHQTLRKSHLDFNTWGKMEEMKRVRKNGATYDVYATRDLMILSRTKVFSSLSSLWESLRQRRITSNRKTDRLIVSRRQASLVSWNGNGKDKILEPVPEDALITILEEYHSALARALDRLQKSS